MTDLIDRNALLAAVQAGEHTTDTIVQIESAESVVFGSCPHCGEPTDFCGGSSDALTPCNRPTLDEAEVALPFDPDDYTVVELRVMRNGPHQRQVATALALRDNGRLTGDSK